MAISRGSGSESVPVARPLLPPAAAILPFIERIDRSRTYTNIGPLSRELEELLSAHFDSGPGTIQLVCNATMGLAIALAAQVKVPRGLCLMPSWTFVATPHAARLAGLTPYFLDVDSASWALTPAAVDAALASIREPVAAVVPVMPFGQPIDFSGWDEFQRRTGIPVVIDAAAGFDSIEPGECAAVVSLHATKVMGIGEGGFILSRNKDLIASSLALTNLGFRGSREAKTPAFNGKISEYACAVGLAHYPQWAAKRRQFIDVASAYRRYLADVPGVAMQDGFGDSWIAATCTVAFERPIAAGVAAILNEQGINTRSWWGNGCHHQPAYADCPQVDLPVTEALAERSLGLPYYVDMEMDTVRRVVEALRSAVLSLSR